MELILRFSGYLHKYRVYAGVAVACVMAELTLELIIPLIMADLVDVGVAR